MFIEARQGKGQGSKVKGEVKGEGVGQTYTAKV
jgi:hypothetical protein